MCISHISLLSFIFFWSVHHRHLHSFPTRRSSDLFFSGDLESIRAPMKNIRISVKIRNRVLVTYSEKNQTFPRFSCVRKHYGDRKSTRLNSSHVEISYAVFCLKKKKNNN